MKKPEISRAALNDVALSVHVQEQEEPLSPDDVVPGVLYLLNRVNGPARVDARFSEHLKDLGASVPVVDAATAARLS